MGVKQGVGVDCAVALAAAAVVVVVVKNFGSILCTHCFFKIHPVPWRRRKMGRKRSWRRPVLFWIRRSAPMVLNTEHYGSELLKFVYSGKNIILCSYTDQDWRKVNPGSSRGPNSLLEEGRQHWDRARSVGANHDFLLQRNQSNSNIKLTQNHCTKSCLLF